MVVNRIALQVTLEFVMFPTSLNIEFLFTNVPMNFKLWTADKEAVLGPVSRI